MNKFAKYEYYFLIFGFIFGLFFVFVNPPFQTNDEDRHFLHSYYLADGVLIPKQGTGKIGGELPKNLVEVVKTFQGIPFSATTKIDAGKFAELKNIPLNPSDKDFYHNYSYSQNPIPFIPSAIGVFIGKMFSATPVSLNYWGRITDLLCFLVLMFFTIRITPIFKSVFFLYGLTPMVLFQASSVTYDMMINGVSFLLIALFLYYALEKEKLENKDIYLLLGMIFLHSCSKTGYPLIPALILIIPPSKFGEVKKGTLLLAGFLVFIAISYFLPDWLWGKMISHLNAVGGIQVLKKDLVHNPADNKSYYLSHIGEFIEYITKNLFQFRQEWTAGTMGRFGYSYTLMPDWWFMIHGLALMVFAFLDSKKEIIITAFQRTVIALVGFGTMFLIIAGMFFNSPIGARMVFGLQGRYFIPAIPVLLLLLYNSHWENKRAETKRTVILLAFTALTLTYTLVYLNGIFWL